MSKRKLSRQQTWRVEKIQAERAKRAARRDAQAESALNDGELGPEREGLIIAHYGTQVAVEADNGDRQRAHLRANLDGLVTGDRVIWCAGTTTGVVVAQLPRNSELSRPDNQGKLKTVAANIDQIIVVVAPYPQPHASLIDRYLVAAETVEIQPVLLLNKRDLLDADPALSRRMTELMEPYRTVGYQLLYGCAKRSTDSKLVQALDGKTSIFVGQSGVGKSSLVNRLLPEADARVGALSEGSLKGTHTTTTAQLFHLEGGGCLIDSPGIREFGLWHLSRNQAEQGFIEFRPYLGHCKFRDCHHDNEPGCAVLQAVADGAISERRLASYRHIVATLEDSYT